jgi:hypothetical protein
MQKQTGALSKEQHVGHRAGVSVTLTAVNAAAVAACICRACNAEDDANNVMLRG